MTQPSNYDDLIKLISDGYTFSRPIYGEWRSARSNLLSSSGFSMTRAAWVDPLPSLPSGVAGYRLLSGSIFGSATSSPFWITRQVTMGSLDISTNTFTSGASTPTESVLGNSYQHGYFAVAEVTTALNATPGNLAVTYTNTAGNSLTTSALAMTASSGVYGASPLVTTGAVRSVTGMARTSGTTPTGVVTVYGLQQLAMGPVSITSQSPLVVNPITGGRFQLGPLLGAGEVVSMWYVNSLAARNVHGKLTFLAEPSS